MTDDEVPLVLVDTSFLRNGRSGLLLTNRAVYSDRLPHPIALEDMGAVRHRPPDAQISLVEGGMVLLHFLFPPAILLLLPWAGRPDQSSGLEVIAGDGGYAVRTLPGGSGGSVGPDVERVVEITRGFMETGSVG